jgi:hypothetical protein
MRFLQLRGMKASFVRDAIKSRTIRHGTKTQWIRLTWCTFYVSIPVSVKGLNPDSFASRCSWHQQMLLTFCNSSTRYKRPQCTTKIIHEMSDLHGCNSLSHGLVADDPSFGISERKLSRKPRFPFSLSLFGILCCKGNSSVARWFGVPFTDHAKSI